ncbi:MAG: class D sortase [Terracidiphilus sp.]|jgi:sortase A
MMTIAKDEIFVKRGQRFIRWTRLFLLMSGVLAFSYVGLTLLDAKLYQERAGSALEKQIQAQEAHETGPSKLALKEGDVLGRIEISRIGLSVVVLEGTTSQTLRRGVGHIEGTALPGERGNIGIAGHRDTYFRALKDIRANDEIQLETASGIAKYDVDWIQITAPSDGGIVSSKSESTLTLVTCYPFQYIGAAPERFVVHAHRQ